MSLGLLPIIPTWLLVTSSLPNLFFILVQNTYPEYLLCVKQGCLMTDTCTGKQFSVILQLRVHIAKRGVGTDT